MKMVIKSYKEKLNDVIRPDRELVKNPYTVAHEIKKILMRYYKPCQLGLIPEMEHSIGLPPSKLPCHICPNYDHRKLKCGGWE